MRFSWSSHNRRQGPPWLGIVVSTFMLIIGIGSFGTSLLTSRDPFLWLFMIAWCGIVIANLVHNITRLVKERKKKTDSETHYNPYSGRFESGSRFCPYCGANAEGDFQYCNRCGRRLP